jgi:hypothetical protein
MTTVLTCVSPEAAAAVASEAARAGDETHTATADGHAVTLAYFDRRYPYDVASWALDNGHAEDAEAAATIASL